MDTRIEINKKVVVKGETLMVTVETEVGSNVINIYSKKHNWPSEDFCKCALSQEQVEEFIALLSEAFATLQKEIGAQ